jgi:iron complex outermembrane receptor protein
MTQKILTFIVFIFAVLSVNSQITGTVLDSVSHALPYCAVGLLKSDSTILKGTMTDDKGKFEFNIPSKGKYIVKVSAAGSVPLFSRVFETDSSSSVKLEPLIVKKSAVNLKEVEIMVMKEPLEFKNGNIIVNIDGTPLAIGNTAFELLNRLPGVMVENDNITVQGLPGVRLYIDDRLQPFTGAQLMNFLKSLNSSNIEKIEIITNPPAKYDAAGAAAIINIKTKKVKITGFSGTVNYTYSKGHYGTNDAGFSLNYKGKKINMFSSVSAYEGLLKNETYFNRKFRSDTGSVEYTERSAEMDQADYMTVNLGADWFPGKNTTIGFKTQGLIGDATRSYPGVITTSNNVNSYDQIRFTRATPNTWLYCNYNINAEHIFDTAGTKLKFSADCYNPYYDIYKSNYETKFLDRNGNDFSPSFAFQSDNTIALSVLSSKLDFESKPAKDVELNAGVKASKQEIFSDYALRRSANGTDFVTDSNFTNKITYKELITAAYFDVQKKIGKINLNLGLRAENTEINTVSPKSAVVYSRQYFKVFPVVSIDFNHHKDHLISLSANTRIQRPDYYYLNPYKSFNNLLVSTEGNPFLYPEYVYNMNLNYTYKSKITQTLHYGYHRNVLLGYPSQVDSTRETVYKFKNIDYLNDIRYIFFVRHEIRKWWIFSANFGAYFLNMSGNVENSKFYTSAVPWWIWSNNQFMLSGTLKFEISGFYWSPWLGGINKMQERWSLNAGLKKSFLDNKLNIGLRVNDIFFTQPFRSVTKFQNQDAYRSDANDTRRLNISVSYNFGKVKAEQRDLEASEDEKSRMRK